MAGRIFTVARMGKSLCLTLHPIWPCLKMPKDNNKSCRVQEKNKFSRMGFAEKKKAAERCLLI